MGKKLLIIILFCSYGIAHASMFCINAITFEDNTTLSFTGVNDFQCKRADNYPCVMDNFSKDAGCLEIIFYTKAVEIMQPNELPIKWLEERGFKGRIGSAKTLTVAGIMIPKFEYRSKDGKITELTCANIAIGEATVPFYGWYMWGSLKPETPHIPDLPASPFDAHDVHNLILTKCYYDGEEIIDLAIGSTYYHPQFFDIKAYRWTTDEID